jgi:cell division ATPase FtsA
MKTSPGQVITGLDVGSSKIATVIGRETPEGLEILGMGNRSCRASPRRRR